MLGQNVTPLTYQSYWTASEKVKENLDYLVDPWYAVPVDRFFQTTRGKIVEELRRRKSASAVDLAEVFGLSPNAVRQQLVVLERDGLVVERPVRRGKTKPTLEFSLTGEAEKLFPQHYDKMLGAVLREVKTQFGAAGVNAVFDGIAKRTAARVKQRVTAADPEQKVAQLAQVLGEDGVVADYNLIEGGFELREHNCPYSEVAKEHPEVCSVIHQVLDETIGGTHVQTESLATGGDACTFQITETANAAPREQDVSMPPSTGRAWHAATGNA